MNDPPSINRRGCRKFAIEHPFDGCRVTRPPIHTVERLMTSPSPARASLRVGLAIVLLASFGCADPGPAPVLPTAPNLGKAPTSGPAVSAAAPAYGRQGETGEDVTITGSGFAPGAVATWSRNGDTSKVSVRSTRYVS